MTKNILITALVALVVSLGAGFAVKTHQNVSGLSERDVQAVSLKVGSNGTKVTKEIIGICNASTTELPLEATSTDAFTCTVTGAASGDNVQVFLPSDNGSTYGGFTVSYARASTNTITFGVQNNSGAATSTFAAATTSVQYRVTDY